MIDIIVPLQQEGTKAKVINWLKKVGDSVSIDDPLVELETDKVVQEIPAPAAGVLFEIVLGPDSAAPPGTVLGRLTSISSPMKDVSVRPAATVIPGPSTVAASFSAHVLSPAVRRAVKEHYVDVGGISGTGKGGRITRADVDKFVAARGDQILPKWDVLFSEGQAAEPIAQPKVSPQAPSNTKSVPHDRMRLAIAENMLNSVTVAPHVTAVFEADFSAIMAHRRKHKPAFEKEGVNLTFTAYFIAACVAAMRAAPAVNSRWFDDRLEIYDDINVGVGTALGDKGLIVPVVQKAQDLSLQGIASRLGDLIGRARENKLSGADVRGGTFTISNHGTSGSLFASPIIILQPQSAILGIGKLEKRVVVREVAGQDTIQIRPMAYVSLTIDHRVLDGHQTNTWLSKFVETLETWPS